MAKPEKENNRSYLNWLGLTVLLVCYLGALANVVKMKKAEAEFDTIRITHWQLELGVRDGLDAAIADFEAKKAAEGEKVRIVQIPVTERAYQQYVTTQLIGGTAPDMIEIGFFPEELLSRYFMPLSKIIQQPNPLLEERYQKLAALPERTEKEQTELDLLATLKDKPWMDTFTDGLRSQFNDRLQEYYGVGFSQFTIRMFYNKDLFKKILGHDDPPKTFRELINDCQLIKEYDNGEAESIIPVASSKYQAQVFKSRYISSMTSDLVRHYDLDMDGWNTGPENLVALLTGEWTPYDEQYRAAIQVIDELAQYFPKGFMSLGRMDSGFSFVQGQAAMITSGSWDARSYLKKIQDQPEGRRFEVGIFDIPMISKDDEKYGQFADGQISEASSGTGFSFGITRLSKHPELCIEFLQFCTTPHNNTILNEKAEWIPSVRGAEATDMLKKFEPNYVGYWGQMNFDVGDRTRILGQQVYWPYISGEIDYDEYARRLMKEHPAQAAVDFARAYNGFTESLPNRYARRSAWLISSMIGPAEEQADAQRKLLRTWDSIEDSETGPALYDAMLERAEQAVQSSGKKPPEYYSNFMERFNREMGR